MRSFILAPLSALLTLTACAGAPPKRVPTPAKTIVPAAFATPLPSPCDEADALLAWAKAAFDEGRLLRARRWLPQASVRCPSRAAEALALELRAAVSLNDVDAIARLKSAAAGAPDSPALREAFDNQTPFGGDIPADIAPSTKDEDYYRAARAFVDGKLEEAGRGAMSVVLSGSGPLLKEAFVLAARVAEAAGDVPRANRMFARAFHAACGSGCELLVDPPSPTMFSLAATYPGLRPWRRSCVLLVGGGGFFEMLTPDGRLFGTSGNSSAEIRTVPERILVHRIETTGSESYEVACFSEKALFYLHYRLHDRSTVFVGPVGGKLREVAMPPLFWVSDFNLPMVTPSGGILVPNTLDFDHAREWYFANPGDRALKRLHVPGRWFEPVLLPSGEILGFEHTYTPRGTANPDAWLVVLDGMTGKRLRRLGQPPDGTRLVLSPDGQTVVYEVSDRDVGVFDLSKKGIESARNNAPPSPNGQTLQILRTTPRGLGPLAAVIDSSHAVFYGDDVRFVVSDLVKGSFEPATIIAGPLGRMKVSGDRIVIKIGDSLLALRLSDGRVSRDEPGVSYAPPPTARPPGWDRERPRPPCILPATIAHSGALLSKCGNAIWRDHPHTQAPAEFLGTLPDFVAGFSLDYWDEGSGLFFLTEPYGRVICYAVEKRIETLRVRFTNAGTGGIAIDSKGYFEFFGEVPAAFRHSSTCADTMPVEACADLYETPGLVWRFLARDFSYRGP